MIGAAELPPLNDNTGDRPADEQTERVFVRIVATRPGAPWDQQRQAGLEARLGAPARLSDIVWRLRRLDGWRPGAPARFAVVYARGEDAKAGMTAAPLVEGRKIAVSFGAPAHQARRLSGLLVVALGAAAVIGGGALVVGQVAARREAASQEIEAVERIAAVRVKRAGEVSRLKRQARILDGERVQGLRMSKVLSDLAWASMAKSPDAHVQAFHWDHGFIAVEVEGDTPPFPNTDRKAQRSRKPVGPGVWLWGLATEGNGALPHPEAEP